MNEEADKIVEYNNQIGQYQRLPVGVEMTSASVSKFTSGHGLQYSIDYNPNEPKNKIEIKDELKNNLFGATRPVDL